MRASGILLPVTSLPSKYGIGCFSKEAYEFVDSLKAAGQKYWQILPLGPTGYGDSPYQSFSTYAGNPYFIDLKTLEQEGLLKEEECTACDFGDHPEYVDYEKIYKTIDEDGDEDEYTYLKLMDVSKQVIINRIQDYLQSRIVYYLMNLHIRPRSIWLSRVCFDYPASWDALVLNVYMVLN